MAEATEGSSRSRERSLGGSNISFYQVGPTMAPYMICDWQLWLWNEGGTGVFEAFKLDEFHIQFVDRYGAGIIPRDSKAFIVKVDTPSRSWLDPPTYTLTVSPLKVVTGVV